MRIAIISDIHGNLEALKSTLNDISKRNIDEIICLGDIIAKGVHPKECIELIKENCKVVIQGNCDYHFAREHDDLDKLPEIEQKRILWNQSLLRQEDREYLSNLPYSYEFYMSGSLVRLLHASPEKINFTVTNNDSIETKYKMFLPSKNIKSDKIADVLIYGHIHHPFMDKIYNKTLINIGSVGNSFDVIRNEEKDSSVQETCKSFYLILEGEYGSKEYTSDLSFQFVRVPYDIDKELVDESINLEKDAYRLELKEGRYRNMEKVEKYFKDLGVKDI